jgi:hypothetical protein
MTARYYPIDPAFDNSHNGYAEYGTTGYDGKGWYYFHGGQLWGPFDTEQEARLEEHKQENKAAQ